MIFSWLLLLAAEPTLSPKLAAIAADARGTVAVACAVPGERLDCNLAAGSHPPMQSVFKFPLVLAMLARVQKGDFQLDQPIRFLASDRILPETYSPLQDKYPQGDVDVPLRELLRLSVSLSDNTASDVLLRVIGGPAAVTAYIQSLGVNGFHLGDNEAVLHRDAKAQYRNWFEPASAVALLRRLADKPPLNHALMSLLDQWMTESPTGADRVKKLLPAGASFAHKTGTSGARDGMRAATNDIGLILLPDGRRLAIAVFVTDAKASLPVIESVMARIGKAVYEAALAAR